MTGDRTLRYLLTDMQTISCLLIHPNPDSALNSAAGSLLQDDFEAFAEQARLMTSIHARIPATLRQAVAAAKRRGEEDCSDSTAEEMRSSSVTRVNSRPNPTPLRKTLPTYRSRPSPLLLTQGSAASEDPALSDDEEKHDPAKENDPSQSPSLVVQIPRSPRKNVLGKRPLSELPTPTDPEDGMTESEKNVAVNQVGQPALVNASGPAKKSPKLAVSAAGANASGRLREDASDGQESMSTRTKTITPPADDEKENTKEDGSRTRPDTIKIPLRAGQNSSAGTARPMLRKVSSMGSSKGKLQARVGIRRL